VARGLRRCFGFQNRRLQPPSRTTTVGRLIEDFILQGGVETEFNQVDEVLIGIGRDTRNGLNFTERGFGVRGAVGIPEPWPHGPPARLKPGGFRLGTNIFGKMGVRWLHTGGIFRGPQRHHPPRRW